MWGHGPGGFGGTRLSKPVKARTFCFDKADSGLCAPTFAAVPPGPLRPSQPRNRETIRRAGLSQCAPSSPPLRGQLAEIRCVSGADFAGARPPTAASAFSGVFPRRHPGRRLAGEYPSRSLGRRGRRRARPPGPPGDSDSAASARPGRSLKLRRAAAADSAAPRPGLAAVGHDDAAGADRGFRACSGPCACWGRVGARVEQSHRRGSPPGRACWSPGPSFAPGGGRKGSRRATAARCVGAAVVGSGLEASAARCRRSDRPEVSAGHPLVARCRGVRAVREHRQQVWQSEGSESQPRARPPGPRFGTAARTPEPAPPGAPTVRLVAAGGEGGVMAGGASRSNGQRHPRQRAPPSLTIDPHPHPQSATPPVPPPPQACY